MSRPTHPEDDESTLFDLPLHGSSSSPEKEADSQGGDASPPTPPSRPLAPESPKTGDEPFGNLPDASAGAEAPAGTATEAPNISFAMTLPFDGKGEERQSSRTTAESGSEEPQQAGFGSLLLAGIVDLGLIFTGLVVAVLGAAQLGTPPGPSDAPALAVLALTFSFPYFVVPLAFWGRTAGMAAFSLFSRSHDGRPLSFRQGVLRWIAALLTVATAGLCLLVALSGRSLADHLSGTNTLSRH